MFGTTSSQHQKALFIALCCGIVMLYLDTTAANLALPSIGTDLGIPSAQLPWVIDAYTLAFASLLLAAGALGDTFGRGRLFVVGFFGFTIASILCALAPSATIFLGGRLLQGLFAAVMIPLSLANISGLYAEPAARARAIGVWAGLGGLALAAGPVVGGVLVERLGWRSVFWLNVPIGLPAALVLARCLPPEGGVTKRRLDIVGLLLFVAGIGLATFALIEGSRLGWLSVTILVCAATSLIALIAFVVCEARTEEPLLPLSLFKNPILIVACTVNFVALFGMFTVLYTFALYFQQMQRMGALEAGLCFLLLMVPVMIASYAASGIAHRIGPKIPVVGGAISAAAGLYLLSYVTADSNITLWGPAFAAIGVGVSFVGAPTSVVLLASVPRDVAGTVSGIFNTFRQVGAVFGIALSGAFISKETGGGTLLLYAPSTEAFLDGLHGVTKVAAAGALIGACTAVFLLTSTKRN